MIKFFTDKNEVSLGIEGNVPTLLADTACLIHAVYEAIKEKNEKLANVYKEELTDAVKVGAVFMDADELERLNEERRKKAKRDVEKNAEDLKDFMKFLESVLEEVEEGKTDVEIVDLGELGKDDNEDDDKLTTAELALDNGNKLVFEELIEELEKSEDK